MFYYSVDGRICCSPNGELPYEKIACPTRADALFYLMDRSAFRPPVPGSCWPIAKMPRH